MNPNIITLLIALRFNDWLGLRGEFHKGCEIDKDLDEGRDHRQTLQRNIDRTLVLGALVYVGGQIGNLFTRSNYLWQYLFILAQAGIIKED